jgi:hypothetical protein
MVEALNIKLEWELNSRGIHGLCTAIRVKRINHLQFVDDTLLLGGTSKIIA